MVPQGYGGDEASLVPPKPWNSSDNQGMDYTDNEITTPVRKAPNTTTTLSAPWGMANTVQLSSPPFGMTANVSLNRSEERESLTKSGMYIGEETPKLHDSAGDTRGITGFGLDITPSGSVKVGAKKRSFFSDDVPKIECAVPRPGMILESSLLTTQNVLASSEMAMICDRS